jgi:hypothetical protein
MKYISGEKRDAIIEILNEFKKSNPWSGKIHQRKEKFNNCFVMLNNIANLKDWQIYFDIPEHYSEWQSSGMSHTDFEKKIVYICGRLSVLTLIHEWCHAALQSTDEEEVRFNATSLFAEVFPEKLENLEMHDGFLSKKNKDKMYWENEVR